MTVRLGGKNEKNIQYLKEGKAKHLQYFNALCTQIVNFKMTKNIEQKIVI